MTRQLLSLVLVATALTIHTVANGQNACQSAIEEREAAGAAPRDYLHAPGYRDIHFERGVTLQVRDEATNAFNLVSLNAPKATLSSTLNGKITSAASPRLIQVGMRLTF